MRGLKLESESQNKDTGGCSEAGELTHFLPA